MDGGQQNAVAAPEAEPFMQEEGETPISKSASATKMETCRFQHKWTIDQFLVQMELNSVGEALQSNAFGSTDNRYKFQLKLFPAGKDEECRGYLSLFLQIQRCPAPKLRFRVNFYIDTAEGQRACALNRNVVTINKGGIVTASKFFSTDTLKARAARLLPNDTLNVVVELTVFGEQVSRDVPHTNEDSIETCGSSAIAPNIVRTLSLGSLGGDMSALLRDDSFADCILYVGDTSFKAHKAILSARSPVFAAMFGHEQNSEAIASEAHLEDVTAGAMEALLEFIYTDRCMNISHNTEHILAAADKYCLEQLKSHCEARLSEEITQRNVADRLRLADAYSAAQLRRKSLDIFRKHKQEILASQFDLKDWTELECECPSLAAGVLKEIVMGVPPGPSTHQEELAGPSRTSLLEPPINKKPRL